MARQRWCTTRARKVQRVIYDLPKRSTMTTTAAGNLADKDKDREKEKEKPGMRRALGRGLASLLPGPRVVTPAAAAASAPSPAAAPTAAAPVAAPAARPQQGVAVAADPA